MRVLAHRGRFAGSPHPDNTLAALEGALRAGRDGVEVDVRRTADGEAVLFHDRLVPDGRPVSALTRAELSRAAGHDVPTLAEALALVGDAFADVELKSADSLDASEPALRGREPGRTLVTSFRHDLVVEAARRLALPCGVIVAHRPASADAAPWRAFRGHPGIRTLVWEMELLDPALVAMARADGFASFAWGAATAADLERAAALGLDAVVADR